MSRYSSLHHTLFSIERKISMEDDYGYGMGVNYTLNIAGHEFSFHPFPNWWRRPREWKHLIDHQYCPFNYDDSEGLYWQITREQLRKPVWYVWAPREGEEIYPGAEDFYVNQCIMHGFHTKRQAMRWKRREEKTPGWFKPAGGWRIERMDPPKEK